MGLLDKMKNLFTDEVEEEVIKSEVIQVEIPAPSPLKEEVKEEKIEEKEEIKEEVVKKEEKQPIFFDDDYFKELERPRREIKSSYIKEVKKDDKKQFKPTPIISPIYGVLDKNYNKDDIKQKRDKVVYKKETSITIDEVRNKAFGTLEDDLENTLFGSNSILFNDEVNRSNDLFEELTDDSSDIDILDLDDNLTQDKLSDNMTSSELLDLIDAMYEKGDK